MGLSGSQTAYKLAVADVARADATRSAYFLRNVVPVWINGAARTGVVQQSIRIDLNTGEEPHRCSFEFKGGSGFVPQAGHEVTIGHGTTDNRLFSGRLLQVTRTAVRNDDKRPTYRCDAVGYVFELGTARVSGFSARSLSPSSIVRALFAATSPSVTSMGFGTLYIDATLPAVEQFETGAHEDLPGALGRLFRAVDARWYVDHRRGLHAFASVESFNGGIADTLSANSATFWGLEYTPTDLSRVFTVAQVYGAAVNLLADVLPGVHTHAPIPPASILVTDADTANKLYGGEGSLRIGGADYPLNGNGIPGVCDFEGPEGLFGSVTAPAVFLPASRGANTLTVVANNISSQVPLRAARWYDISGQLIYVSSQLGVYSATASSIAYSFWVASGRSGAITADIAGFADIAGVWNANLVNLSTSLSLIPAGAPLQVYRVRVSSPNANKVTSLFGGAAYGFIQKTFEDQRLSPTGAGAVASEAIDRGNPDNWKTIVFNTRDRYADIGRPVFVSITSPAEPSGHSIVGAFTAHDVTMGEFGRLTETRGPVRTITAGTVRRPTLWQVLQGD